MYFADFETTTSAYSDTMSKVYLWGIKGTLEHDKLEYGVDLKSFFEEAKAGDKKHILFHNLAWDGDFIFKWLLDEGFNFMDLTVNEPSLSKLDMPYNTFGWICNDAGKIFRMIVNYEGHIFQFEDSYLVLVESIAKLGEAIKLPKLDLDYDAKEFTNYKTKADVSQEVLAYLERDIDIAMQTYKMATADYEPAMTRSSMAYKDFSNFYNKAHNNGVAFAKDFGGRVFNYKTRKFDQYNVLTKQQWKWLHESYQGGYTNWNQAFTNLEVSTKKGVSVDENSIYPAIMLQKMPYGKMLNTKPPGDHVSFIKILIHKATKKDPLAPALIRKHGGRYDKIKYLDSVEDTYYTFNFNELQFIKQHYHMQYLVIKQVYFKTKYVFKDWLETKMHLKINAPNTFMRNHHKGNYNGIYGKFCQNYRMSYKNLVKDGNIVQDGLIINATTKELVKKLPKNVLRYGKHGEWKMKIATTELDDLKHIAVGSYITSEARLALWRCIFNNLKIWIYSDTDSCYFLEEPQGIRVHDSDFGAWKYEYKFDKIKVLRAKAYLFASTHKYIDGQWKKHEKHIAKISGASQKAREQLNFSNFYLGYVIKNGKHQSKSVQGGKLIYEADFTLGEGVG